MANLDFEQSGSIYINQNLCFYYEMLLSWCKKLQNTGKMYSQFVPGGTIKITIHEDSNSI